MPLTNAINTTPNNDDNDLIDLRSIVASEALERSPSRSLSVSLVIFLGLRYPKARKTRAHCDALNETNLNEHPGLS